MSLPLNHCVPHSDLTDLPVSAYNAALEWLKANLTEGHWLSGDEWVGIADNYDIHLWVDEENASRNVTVYTVVGSKTDVSKGFLIYSQPAPTSKKEGITHEAKQLGLN
jgi:hypothetical protein